MHQVHLTSTPEDIRPLPHQVPPTGQRITPRPRLLARLDSATRISRIVLVAAEAGAGKTSLVASWAAQAWPDAVVSWRTVTDHDVLRVLHQLPFEEPGLLSTVDRSVLVLDGFPADADYQTQDALRAMMRRMGAQVCVVLVCTGTPRLDLQRLGVNADSFAVDSDELAMNKTEIAAVLARHAVAPEPELVDGVWRRTLGWAWGVRLAASQGRSSSSVPDQLRALDRAVADYLDGSVLGGLTRLELELLTADCVVEQANGGLPCEIGERLPSTVAERTRGFVRTHADGSFTVHPLLRHQLVRRLRNCDDATREAARRAARALVDDLRVLRLLSAPADPLLDRPELLDHFGAVEPTLLAAAVLRRGWADLAARALGEGDPSPTDEPVSVAGQLGDALTRMALARWQGQWATGLEWHQRALGLLPRLSVAQRTAHPALVPLLHAHRGAFESGGFSDEARVDLERGARAFRTKAGPRSDPGTRAAAADCLGQLAWWQARAGELTDAARHAADLLADQQHGSGRVGPTYARLALVWCHLSSGDVERAAELFASASVVPPCDAAALPELVAASELTAARLAVLGAPVVARVSMAEGPYAHELALVEAEAELDAGSPAAALAILAEAAAPVSAHAQVLRARAAIQLGDVAGAAAAMRRRPVESVTVLCQVQLELVEAWLAGERHDRTRERVLVDRALRTAGREQLRTPLGWAKPWLHEVITSEPELVRRHGHFLASVNGTMQHQHVAVTVLQAPVAPLTGRELDILQRLGALRTNEEIAADLFLSANTVKSHLKSLFRKLDVTRRSEAFRKGRALGLC